MTLPPDTGRANDRWENEGGQTPSIAEGEAALSAELTRLGIQSSTVAIYEWHGFRYTNASDAIAAARRAELST